MREKMLEIARRLRERAMEAERHESHRVDYIAALDAVADEIESVLLVTEVPDGR